MSATDADTGSRAAELRAAFDRSFAEAPKTEAAVVAKLLAIRIGADPYAIGMSEVGGLWVDKKITPVPSVVPELLGIVGLRTVVLPVYDLGMLLGRPRSGTPRWLLTTATSSVALAFDGFDGYLRVRSDAVVPNSSAQAPGWHVREVVESADLARPLISLASVLEWIRDRVSRTPTEKE